MLSRGSSVRLLASLLATNEDEIPKYQAICEKLGDLAAAQGAYSGAAKKYLDAGNKTKVSSGFLVV